MFRLEAASWRQSERFTSLLSTLEQQDLEVPGETPSHSHGLLLMPVPLLRICVSGINTATLVSPRILSNETCTNVMS